MAAIELISLPEHLDSEELDELRAALSEAEAPALPPEDGEPAVIVGRLDSDVLDEFMDRLDGEDAACDLYLPVEFDVTLEVADRRVGSLQKLLDTLEELRDDMGIDEDEVDADDIDEDEPEGLNDIELIDAALRQVWHYLRDGADTATDRSLALLVRR